LPLRRRRAARGNAAQRHLGRQSIGVLEVVGSLGDDMALVARERA
jgi:hypothetical protein